LLFVGHVTESKGVWTLLRALRLLRDRDLDVRAVLIGEPTNQREYERIQRDVIGMDLADAVELAGRRTGTEKWREFVNADVFCFPSHYENEALPLAIIEALQFAIPVVGSDWRGIPSLIQEGVTGFIVPPKDPERLADRIALLATDPDLRAKMSASARTAYLERYTLDHYLAAMEAAMLAVAEKVRVEESQGVRRDEG
jgi:glycosyltransferase involved in cell wall biosynthesis